MLKNISFIFVVLMLFSCGKDTMPKPKGELRLEYPQPKYQVFDDACHYQFEYSTLAKVFPSKKNECWFNLIYPQMKGKVFITYYPIKNNLTEHIKEAEKMVYKHTIKASSIETKVFEYPEHKAYGNFYELKGQSASNIQFFVTDSTKHFVTASLYFNSRPKPDSIAPAVRYVKKDLKHLIETFQWK
ncbi:MAG: gliding motility lipoprotein GldD [Flavobacteriales bacterium]|nr:MAG: gliding motility lipoprotein GldD [Flavobacteriales bacterium]